MVGDAVAVAVGVGVSVDVGRGVAVLLGVGVAEGLAVGLGVGELVAVVEVGVAVGTTSTRALESAAQQHHQQWELAPFHGPTDLFILPGYEYKLIDGLITNFHLPKSTLLALLSAFTGMELMRKAYTHAVEQRYRFYSYGDAMIIL